MPIAAPSVQGRTTVAGLVCVCTNKQEKRTSITSLGLFLQQQWIKLCWFTNWPPYKEGKERLKKKAECSRLVGGSANKQGNLHVRLVLGAAR